MNPVRVGGLKTVADLRALLSELQLELPVDDQLQTAAEQSPLAQPYTIRDFKIGNRWVVHPMEGWDGTDDGRPTAETIRRWVHFGQSGCKMIWGGEAFAVQFDGRANPQQLYYRSENVTAINDLYQSCIQAHTDRFGVNAADDLYVGLQLTHSGRFSKPADKKKAAPRILYHHPILDARVGIQTDDDSLILSDGEIRQIIDNYVISAKMAAKIGFQFVDLKHCHGYLGHEFLSAYDRPGKYGGDLQGRTQFLREILEGIRAECPQLHIGVRLSLFDLPPYQAEGNIPGTNKKGPGVSQATGAYRYAFGGNKEDALVPDLTEPLQLLKLMQDELKIDLLNFTAGSPYYNPHIQRPAFYPPSDGYAPPEDPLIGCVRQIQMVRAVKEALPDLPVVGTAYTYFQQYLPHVAQAVVRAGYTDFVGLGRMVLSYWDLPADVLEGNYTTGSKKICRTFSDCTTAPRNGMISGCYPLDDFYKQKPEFQELKKAKA
jgi:2,4-dienoyl-CoA reductase-like NADH-dependent reductase (Old Yellow Enzyme family)